LASGYCSLLKNLLVSGAGDSVVSALQRTIETPAKRLQLPDHHPHLRSFFESVIYLLCCYALLFWLVAYADVAAILNWLDATLWQCSIPSSIYQDQNLRLFVASIIAGIGTVPFAIMSCSFLPARQPHHLFVSANGILFPDRRLWNQMYSWASLRKVSASGSDGDAPNLKLHFTNGSLSFSSKDYDKQTLAEVMAAADEYSDKCSFDAEALKLRVKLIQETMNTSLADRGKFESTIFTPHKPGDFVSGDQPYRVVRKLASRPLNAVYLCRDSENSFVVMKQFVVPSNCESAARQRKIFLREYELLRTVSHPLLVKVLQCFQNADDSYIVLEYIRGTNLRDLVEQRGARNEKLILRWALDICDQLRAMHQMDPPLLHQDISPDNLMLDEQQRIRIVDFGAAHQFMEGVTGTLVGKQAYIAPEQLRGKSVRQSDIYSLGATLYFLLTGNDPKALHSSDPGYSGSVKVSSEVRHLVRSCTAYEAKDRPDSIEQLVSCITKIQNGAPLIAEVAHD
jgi:serine/threonine protein kinase